MNNSKTILPHQVPPSHVFIRFIAFQNKTQQRKNCPIVQKNLKNPEFKNATNPCNKRREHLSNRHKEILNNFMNNYEHSPNKQHWVKINNHNEHSDYLGSVPVVLSI